jgi:drug/metabolite transporter (DMT)-like permease
MGLFSELNVASLLSSSMSGPIAAFCSSITWLIGSTCYTSLARKYHPLAINVARATVALPLYFLITLIQWPAIAQQIEVEQSGILIRALWLIASIIASYVVGDALFFRSAVLIGLPATQALASTFPCWSAAAAVLFAGELLNLPQMSGILLAVLGCIMVVLAGKKMPDPAVGKSELDEKPPSHRIIVGTTFGIATALFWAFNSVAVSKGGHNFPSAPANLLRFIAALAICIALMRISKVEPARARLSTADLRKYLPAFITEACAGTFFYVYGLTHSSISVGTTLTSLAPILSVPVAIALGWEKFSLIKFAGILVGTVGVVVLVSG